MFTPGYSERDIDNVNPLVSEPARKMHVSHRCMSVEFLAGAQRAPGKSGMHVIASQGAEASQWTEIMFAGQGADASQSTEIITGQGTKIINGDASHVAEAGQWTKILNRDASQVAEAGQWTEIIKENVNSEVKDSQRIEIIQDDAKSQADASQGTETIDENEEVPAHMKEFIERSTKGWSKPQQDAIRKMLLQFQDVFSKDELDIGQTHLMETEIDTGDAKPVRSRPRPMAQSMEEEGRKTIEQMEKRGLI